LNNRKNKAGNVGTEHFITTKGKNTAIEFSSKLNIGEKNYWKKKIIRLNHERTKDGNYRKKMKSLWVQ
jgi:hypothetical protein